jgi:hypothetical protein
MRVNPHFVAVVLLTDAHSFFFGCTCAVAAVFGNDGLYRLLCACTLLCLLTTIVYTTTHEHELQNLQYRRTNPHFMAFVLLTNASAFFGGYTCAVVSVFGTDGTHCILCVCTLLSLLAAIGYTVKFRRELGDLMCCRPLPAAAPSDARKNGGTDEYWHNWDED